VAGVDELRDERTKKLKAYESSGKKAFGVSEKPSSSLQNVVAQFDILTEGGELTLAGRVRVIRGQGAIMFVVLDDGTGRFQAVFQEDKIDAKAFALFKETVDMGDIISVTGTLFLTKRLEKSIQVISWEMLTKSLLPLPDKWHGLQDVEERFRKRYLDTLSSEDVKARFILRSRIISEIRRTLDDAGYLEVETPILQAIPGGTNAEPFHTHHNALDINLSLRIAPELYLKRLLVGGFPKVYELARNFRNEGIDVTHNPEFYESYTNAAGQMAFTENMIRNLVTKVFGSPELTHEDVTIDFAKPFPRAKIYDLLTEHAGVKNPATLSRDDFASEAKRLNVAVAPSDTRMKILDNIYKKHVRTKLIQPIFVTDYPVEYLPLAKRKDDDNEMVDAFQLVIGGVELVKGFSELNDPIDQRGRFAQQEKDRAGGDTEAQQTDEDFMEALEYGMPPAGGVGIGIDRLLMVLLGQHNIREVILFPTLRPK
jgi:lysyl-tRNA synthetase, class II